MKFEKYKLKSGKEKWRFYSYLGINPDTGEKEDIERRGFNTKAEARNALLKVIKDYENGQKVRDSYHKKYNFREVTELWLMYYEKQVKITTFMNRKSLLDNHILPYLKKYYIDRIDVRLCQELVNNWYATFSEASRLVNLVSQIFKFGINRGFCQDNPMSKIIRLKNTFKKQRKVTFYDKKELKLFLDTIQKNESLRAYTMFYALAFTGLRRGELFGLQWQDTNFNKKTLEVKRNLIYNEKDKRFEFPRLKLKQVNEL